MEQKSSNSRKTKQTSSGGISMSELEQAFQADKKNDFRINDEKSKNRDKKWFIPMIIGGIGMLGGVGCLVFALLNQSSINSMDYSVFNSTNSDISYSDLTGEVLTDSSLKNTPTYCVQTPNGTDGARPQAGLNQAGVIFEAIAEAGITRFAAIYQNPTSSVIGPIRSLRTYYLEWDTPFNCTIVHAGGADDALAAVKSGNYYDLSEDYNYMYRGSYSGRLWNNLFTTADYLKQYSTDHNIDSTTVNGFARMTEKESKEARANSLAKEKLNITQPATGNTSELEAKVTEIGVNFGNIPAFNVVYNYDVEKNAYLRSYGDGEAHEVYDCPDGNLGEVDPEDTCSLVQMAPSVVVVMAVEEQKASDNYHEDIQTIGSGKAYIFQNGEAITGKWTKTAANSQIKFTDNNGGEIKLAPGKTIVSAIPQEKSVDF